MAYRSRPATQSSNISQFSSCMARRCAQIEIVLQPKNHLSEDCNIHLARILQILEACRKLKGENINAAKDKYKYQHDN